MTTLEIMTEIQKKILEQFLKAGVGFVILAGVVWYQTERIEKQESKFEAKQIETDAKIEKLQTGLFDCNAERAALKVQVDNLSKLFNRKTR